MNLCSKVTIYYYIEIIFFYDVYTRTRKNTK